MEKQELSLEELEMLKSFHESGERPLVVARRKGKKWEHTLEGKRYELLEMGGLLYLSVLYHEENERIAEVFLTRRGWAVLFPEEDLRRKEIALEKLLANETIGLEYGFPVLVMKENYDTTVSHVFFHYTRKGLFKYTKLRDNTTSPFGKPRDFHRNISGRFDITHEGSEKQSELESKYKRDPDFRKFEVTYSFGEIKLIKREVVTSDA